MTHLLEGVTVPLVTALTPDGEPDAASARPLLDALAAAGITRVMFFGTNGEGALLNPHHCGDYLAELVPYWRRIAGPDAVVTATAFGAGTRETRNRARIFREAEPDAIVVAPPYYFIHPPAELEAYYAALDELELPVIAYNAPRYTGNPIGVELLGRIARLPHVVGIKDSGGDDELVLAAVRLADAVEGFGVSQGNERRMAWAVSAGAHGVTPGLGNLAPAECLALVRAVREEGLLAAAESQERLIRLLEIHSVRAGVPAMKAALHLRGLSPLAVSPPLQAYEPAELVRLATVLDSWDGALIG